MSTDFGFDPNAPTDDTDEIRRQRRLREERRRNARLPVWIWYAAGGVLFVLFLGIVWQFTRGDRPSAKSKSTARTKEIDPGLTPTQVFLHYITDPEGADRDYKGTQLRVTGVVEAVKADRDKPLLQFQIRQKGSWTVTAEFDRADFPPTRVGREITVEGRCIGRRGGKGNLELVDCKVIKAP